MAKLNPKFVLHLLLIFGITAFCGCTTTYPNRSSDATQIPALETATLLKFADIPVPAGFVFIPEESYAFQSTNFRAGLLKYRGKAIGDQLVVFFKDQMPMYNWQLINIVEYGRRMLNFEKEGETCVINIDLIGSRSDITLSIAPKSVKKK